VCGNQVLVFGATAQRLVLNAELLEKCAKAFVLATATGAAIHTLPWWVCRIANGRLKKDQKRAEARFAQGLLPEEVKGY
jgi:ribulose-5-phosphate 4-epimerase/fuculose-1-phosphate aldolase